MHGTEIGGLNLDHVAGFGVGEFADVFQRVAPFVGDEFDRDTAFVERCGERSQRVTLGVMRAVIDRSFDPEPERSGEFREGGEVAADRRPVVFREDFADRPVNVDMKATDELLALMPTDDTLKGGQAQANHEARADVLLKAIDGRRATYEIDGTDHVVEMSLNGVYNLINAAAALTLVRRIVGDAVPTQKLLEALGNVRPAFGRGETITYKGVPMELVLVKNPSGFRLSLLSFADGKADNMIAINDNYADGRDISWLWDVD